MRAPHGEVWSVAVVGLRHRPLAHRGGLRARIPTSSASRRSAISIPERLAQSRRRVRACRGAPRRSTNCWRWTSTSSTSARRRPCMSRMTIAALARRQARHLREAARRLARRCRPPRRRRTRRARQPDADLPVSLRQRRAARQARSSIWASPASPISRPSRPPGSARPRLLRRRPGAAAGRPSSAAFCSPTRSTRTT